MTVRVVPALLFVLALGAAVATGGRSAEANQYETLRVHLLTPTLTKVVGTPHFQVGTLSLTDASVPVVFKFEVSNVGDTPLSNVEVKFFPGVFDPRSVVLSASPGARLVPFHAGGFALWTVKSLGGHQRRSYSVTMTFTYVSKGDGKAGVRTSGRRSDINGLIEAELGVIVKVPFDLNEYGDHSVNRCVALEPKSHEF